MVQKLCHNECNLKGWIEKVFKTVLVNDFIDIKISFSYLTINKEKQLFYVWASPGLPSYTLRQTNVVEMEKFIAEFDDSEATVLEKTFENNTEPWNVSEVEPLKLVCSYIYILK